MTHTPQFNVSGTDRDGQNDNCGTADPGLSWVYVIFELFSTGFVSPLAQKCNTCP
jgi:hypothetical protein